MNAFDAHQAETAAWCGYSSAAELNAQHDSLHRALCRWIGIPSHSLAGAAGEDHDADLATVEEAAVLHVQRLIAHHKAEVPA